MNKKLMRNQDSGGIGGVCHGLADYFEMDPSIVRIIFVLLALGTSFPIAITYIILWMILPLKEKMDTPVV